MRYLVQSALFAIAQLGAWVLAAQSPEAVVTLSAAQVDHVVAWFAAGTTDPSALAAVPDVPGQTMLHMTAWTGIHAVQPDGDEDYLVFSAVTNNARYQFAFTVSPRLVQDATVPGLRSLLADHRVTQYHVRSISGANNALTEVACRSRTRRSDCELIRPFME